MGQRVTLSHEAIQRRELYRIRDSAGISERREKGDTVYKAAMMCTGVILDAIEDNQLQTDITYAPVGVFCRKRAGMRCKQAATSTTFAPLQRDS